MSAEREVIGRRIFLYTNSDGTTVAEKPKCCRRIFPETTNLRKSKRSFKTQEYDVSNRERWKKFIGKDSSDEDETVILEKAQSLIDDIDEMLKDE